MDAASCRIRTDPELYRCENLESHIHVNSSLFYSNVVIVKIFESSAIRQNSLPLFLFFLIYAPWRYKSGYTVHVCH
jgi:hypothetical protein